MPIHFKPYLTNKAAYKGGKSKDEINIGNKKIFKLSSNENQLGSSPKALASIQKHLSTLSEYPDTTDINFRKALEDFYNGQLTADQFVTTNSGVANIEVIIRAFMEKDTECIYTNPAFSPYWDFAAKVGGKGIDVPLDGDDYSLDVDGILGKINDRTRLIFITSPNNPTGTHIPKSQVDKLVDNLPDHVVLVYDEVYYQYADAADYVRALPYVIQGKNVIGINSFSKAYGLAGLRVGYSYSTPKLAEYMRRLMRPFMINTISMKAAMAALHDDEFIQKTVNLVHDEKAFLYTELDKLGVKYWKTQANFILTRPNLPSSEFTERILNEGGIMVRPAEGFGAPGCVRITIGTREANQALVEGWKRILEQG